MQSNNDENRSNLASTAPSKSHIDRSGNVIDVIALLKQYNRSQIDKILCTQKTVAAESTSDLNISNDDTHRSQHLEKVNVVLSCYFVVVVECVVYNFRVFLAIVFSSSSSFHSFRSILNRFFFFGFS